MQFIGKNTITFLWNSYNPFSQCDASVNINQKEEDFVLINNNDIIEIINYVLIIDGNDNRYNNIFDNKKCEDIQDEIINYHCNFIRGIHEHHKNFLKFQEYYKISSKNYTNEHLLNETIKLDLIQDIIRL